MADTPSISTFDELKAAAQDVCEGQGVAAEAYRVIREVERLEILSIVEKEYQKTGTRLPKGLKRELADRFSYSEKGIESMIYEYLSG